MPRDILERVERVRDFHQSTKYDEAACKAAQNPENPAAQPNPYRVFDHLPKVPLPTKLLDAGSPAVALMHGGLASLPESQLHPPQDLRTLATWLYSITMNVCLTRLERGTRSKVVPMTDPLGDDLVSGAPDEPPDAERHAFSAEARIAIERALGELDHGFRAVIILRDREDLRYEEIAQILDIPINTVKTRIHRARAALQQKLGAFRP